MGLGEPPTIITDTTGIAERYLYNADGERVAVTRSGTTTVYVGSGLWEEILGGTATQ